MSEADTDTKKAPLWKQLLGALAGATFAFMIYQGYTFASFHVQAALVGDHHPGPSGTLGFPVPDVPQTQPIVVAATSSSSPNALVRIWSASMRRMIWTTQSSSSSSSTVIASNSSSPVWAPAAESSSSSEASQSSSPESFDTRLFDRIGRRLDAAALQADSDAAALETSSSSADTVMDAQVAQAVTSTQDPLANPYADAPVSSIAASSSSPDVQPVPEPVVPVVPLSEPAPPLTTVQAHSGKLPQTGFGLDLLAFTALGAVIGSRRSKRK